MNPPVAQDIIDRSFIIQEIKNNKGHARNVALQKRDAKEQWLQALK